ncbi:hypothetical protein [Arthrobacter pascens]|uniref:hypothetical protein n=1 Tax=Arthrobacter pascens TaxID=1677 RepID=UPI00196B321F|nr:hypothetical protein [Arthrobacter pascens]MBN3498595.1 hypothetical protein [Arthrobacter pascens]
MTTTTAPAGFTIPATVGGNIHKGPAAGDVETTWTPEEGFLVYVGDSEGMTVDEARKLAADLRGVLERVADL